MFSCWECYIAFRYVGWKQQFPADLRDCGPVKAQFDHALKLMNEHVANPGRPVTVKVYVIIESLDRAICR
jgi:hypothetical protein